jgi:hypothetical protein
MILVNTAVFSEDSRIEAVGFLGGQNLYFLYTSIGLLADSFYGGVYDSQFSKNLARDMAVSARKSKETFQKLIDEKTLQDKDAEFGTDIIEAYDTIINEVNAFMSTVDVNNEETVGLFRRYKTKAWEKIQYVLKLDE